MSKKPREFTPEFKARAAHLVLTEKLTKTRVAKDFGVDPQNISRWVNIHEKSTAEQRPAFTGRGIPALIEQEKRIKALEREVYVLRQEREIVLPLRCTCLALEAAPDGPGR